MRFTEMDQLEEPDQKTCQRWLADVVKAGAIGYEDPFNIAGKDQVTLEYLNGMELHHRRHPQKRTRRR
jgi:hypothetical protein